MQNLFEICILKRLKESPSIFKFVFCCFKRIRKADAISPPLWEFESQNRFTKLKPNPIPYSYFTIDNISRQKRCIETTRQSSWFHHFVILTMERSLPYTWIKSPMITKWRKGFWETRSGRTECARREIFEETHYLQWLRCWWFKGWLLSWHPEFSFPRSWLVGNSCS